MFSPIPAHRQQAYTYQIPLTEVEAHSIAVQAAIVAIALTHDSEDFDIRYMTTIYAIAGMLKKTQRLPPQMASGTKKEVALICLRLARAAHSDDHRQELRLLTQKLLSYCEEINA